MIRAIKYQADRSSIPRSGAGFLKQAFLIASGLITISESAFPSVTPSVTASDSTIYLSTSGSLQAAGLNTSGQLGVGDTFSRSVFHTISFPPAVSQIWSGPKVTYLRKTDGTLWACGSGTYGLLGDGKSNSSSFTLVQVGVANDWKEVSLGNQHVVGIKDNGTLWTWGFSSSGALGQGSFPYSLTNPTQAGTATDWLTVAAGEYHNLAIKTDGTLWAWGLNSSGQVGNGTTTTHTTPVQIGTLNGWKSIAAGREHSLAIRTDGSLWAWGGNYYGQLGNSTTTSSNVPLRIGTGDQWKAVTAGLFHSLAQLSDNTLQAWGQNSSGQLGVGDTVQRNSPTALTAGGTWQAFDAGSSHSAAIRSDGTLSVWGNNANGQLGPGAALISAPQVANLAPLPNIALSISTYPLTDSALATDGLTTLYFPLTAEQTPKSATVKIFNHGTAQLSVSAMTVPAGFTVAPQAPLTLAPGASQTLTATIDTTVTGNLTRSLVITSNDTDETDFHLNLSGTVLAVSSDTDGDGLNDAAEWYYSALGFNWNSSQPSLVSALMDGTPRAGLIKETQLLAGTPDSTVFRKNPTVSSASLRLRLERSMNLNRFYQAELSVSNIANDGSVEIPLTPGAASEFFRFTVDALPVSAP